MLVQAISLNARWLPGFQFFDSRATFFKKNPVTTVWAPYVDIDLNFLFAPCTFVRTCHIRSVYLILSSATVLSIARLAIFMAGVCGTYDPPANLNPHLRHSQIPVPRRWTDNMSHFGQV
jgi:hypothetical protein